MRVDLTNGLRIVYMGTAAFACPALRELGKFPGCEIPGVVTQPDRRQGRGLAVRPSPVKVEAEAMGLPLWQPEKVRAAEFIDILRAQSADLVVVAAYGQILPPAILELPRLGCLNIHGSLLPRFRGAAPIQWALLSGDSETGVTIMKMDAGLDTGPTLGRQSTPIEEDDDALTLQTRLAETGAKLLIELLPAYAGGRLEVRPQPSEGVVLAPKIRKEQGEINWAASARTVWNKVRALIPWPGAYSTWRGKEGTGILKIWRARPVPGMRGSAGEILKADRDGLIVACGEGAVELIEVQESGGRRLEWGAFLAGHALRPGDRLG